MCTCRDLRKMRDGEDLMVVSDPAKRVTHLQSDFAPDTSVDFLIKALLPAGLTPADVARMILEGE